jgi:malate synthase
VTATRPERLRRSELSTPGTSPKMIAKAAASDADLAFLDLEDAVAPEEKETRAPTSSPGSMTTTGERPFAPTASTVCTPSGATTT